MEHVEWKLTELVSVGGTGQTSPSNGSPPVTGFFTGCIKDVEIRASGVINFKDRALTGRNVDLCAA